MTRIRFLKIPHLTFVRWWIVEFEIEFSKYYLMTGILMRRRVDTQTHHQIWLRGNFERKFLVPRGCACLHFTQVGLLFNKLGNDSKRSPRLNKTRSSLVDSLIGDVHLMRHSHHSFEYWGSHLV